MPTEIEQLYREHRAGLVRLVERELRDHYDAEDVVQTAFLDAQRALERGTIPRNPPAWLAAIALNAGRRLRRRRLNAEPLEDYAVQEALEMPEIRAALTNLPREQRAAVLYRDVLGLSYGETAQQMGTSVNAVTMLLHRGRRQLREALGVAAGGIGLWRWLRQAGTSQVAVAKGVAAVVVGTGLATGGIVAAGHVARVTSPTGTDTTAAPVAHAGSPAAEAGRSANGQLALDSARSHFKTVDGSSASAAASTASGASHGSGGDASPASVGSSTTAAVASWLTPSTLQVPTVSLPTLSTSAPSVPIATTVTVSTPVTTATVATPTGTTATLTTPITTVTVPIP